MGGLHGNFECRRTHTADFVLLTCTEIASSDGNLANRGPMRQHLVPATIATGMLVLLATLPSAEAHIDGYDPPPQPDIDQNPCEQLVEPECYSGFAMTTAG